ncbi:MAG: GntR family transcriptional regulator, partial [Dorea sp.]
MGKLGYRTLRENIVEEIRMKILRKELKPGMRIVEQDLSEEFGVSRGPIREALRQLEQEGMIVYTRNVGCSVKEITLEDIYEIYLLSATYEKLAVREYNAEFSEDD